MSNFGLTVSAVVQVLVAVMFGAVTSRKIPNARVTLRDFSFFVTNILVPSLMISRMGSSLTASLISDCSVLLFVSFLAIVLGYLSAKVLGLIVFQTEPLSCDDSVRVTVDVGKNEFGAPCLDVSGIYIHRHSHQQQSLSSAAVSPSDDEIVRALRTPSAAYEDTIAYRTLSIVGCTVQNTVVVPLSLLTSLQGALPWLDYEMAIAYIFVYNIVVTVFFWGGGTFLVWDGARKAKKAAGVRKLLEMHEKLQSRVDTATSTDDDSHGFTRANFDWKACSLVRVVPPPVSRVNRTLQQHAAEAWKFSSRVLKALYNVPFLATIAGILIGTVPFLHTAFQDEPLAILMSAAELVSGGAVPAALLLLGANLAGSTSTTSSFGDVRFRHAKQNTAISLDSHIETATTQNASFVMTSFLFTPLLPSAAKRDGGFSAAAAASTTVNQGTTSSSATVAVASEQVPAATWLDECRAQLRGAHTYAREMLSLVGVRKSFVIGTLAVRLLLVPGLCFLLIHFLMVGSVTGIEQPQHNTLLLVLFLEVAAPTAINSALLFNVQGFMMHPYAKMLFFEYLAAVVTVTLWMTIALSYVA